ncbi:MAG: hypothetical protein HQ485_00095, partial [Acidobacteria bacterium]|nr:hypothetical protein [Acidobacteriota bacterium]
MNESKATRYQRLRRRAQLASAATGAGLLAIVALTPAAPTLADVSSDLATPWPPALQPVLTLVIFVSVLAFAAAVVAFPVSVYARRRVARRLRPTAAESGSLLWAYGRDALVGTVFALALAVVVRVSLWIGGGGG